MAALHVVVLAAGEGRRMRSSLPKVLHPLGGRPLIEHVLDAAAALAPAAVHCVHGHAGERLREACAGRPIEWVEQPEQLGTGHALGQALPGIPDEACVLVLCGDVPLISPATLEAVVAAAAGEVLGLVTVRLPEPGGYGRIVRDRHGRICSIVEQRDAGPAELDIDEVNTGIVAATAWRLRDWLARLDNANAQGEYYLTDCVALAVADGVEVRAVAPGSPEEVEGVNDRVQLAALERRYQRAQAERLMRAGATLADPARLDVRGRVEVAGDCFLDVNVVLEGEVVLGREVRIGPNVVLRDASIGDRCEVLASSVIEGAELGPGTRVGPFARIRPGTRTAAGVHVGNFVEVKNSRIGEGSKANHLTYLGDSEVGAGVNVGAGTITCNYDGVAKHRTEIGDGAFIGSGVELVAPLRVGAGATIGAGSTISKDAPADALTVSRVRQTTVRGWRRPRRK